MSEPAPERTPPDDTMSDDAVELLASLSGDDKVIAAAALQLRADLPRYPAVAHGFIREVHAWLLSWTGLGPAEDPDGCYADALKVARSIPTSSTPPDGITAPVTAEDGEHFKTRCERVSPDTARLVAGATGGGGAVEDVVQLDDDDTPVTAEGLRERIESALRSTWDGQPTHMDDAIRIETDAVLAALAGDPGDLPARMGEAIDKTWTSEEDFDAEKAAAAAMSVRWEHAAAQAVEVERLRTELAGARDIAGWAETVRDAAVAAVRTAQITHIRDTHPDRMHVANCLACHVLVPLSAAMPARPDDPEEIRRLMQATTEEKSDD